MNDNGASLPWTCHVEHAVSDRISMNAAKRFILRAAILTIQCRKLLLHFRHTDHPWPSPEKCSCVFGIPTIHGHKKTGRGSTRPKVGATRLRWRFAVSHADPSARQRRQ